MKIILSESQFRRLVENDSSSSILIIGDSHSVDAGFTYSSLLKKNFSDVTIAAVGGKRTSWMVSELSNQLSKKKFDIVIIWGGANDMFSNVSISEAISNNQKMVDMVNNQGGNAFIIVGFDQNVFSKEGKYKSTKYATSKQMDQMRKKYIDFQNQLASSISNATIIPAFNIDNSYTSDNSHGNSGAHSKVYQIVKEYLEKNVEKPKKDPSAQKEKNTSPEEYYDFEKINNTLQLLGLSLPQLGFDNTFDSYTKKTSEKPEPKIKSDLKNNIITNSGVNLVKYPSDMVEQFKKIVGRDYDDFVESCKSIGLDPIIAIRQLYTESGFRREVINCSKKSKAGAMGIAQFMPGTWPSYGKGSPCDVKNSLDAYIKFMDVLLKRFPGRPDIAVASYNSGPNLKIYKHALDNDIPFTDLKGRIPSESYKYSASIFQT